MQVGRICLNAAAWLAEGFVYGLPFIEVRGSHYRGLGAVRPAFFCPLQSTIAAKDEDSENPEVLSNCRGGRSENSEVLSNCREGRSENSEVLSNCWGGRSENSEVLSERCEGRSWRGGTEGHGPQPSPGTCQPLL